MYTASRKTKVLTISETKKQSLSLFCGVCDAVIENNFDAIATHKKHRCCTDCHINFSFYLDVEKDEQDLAVVLNLKVPDKISRHKEESRILNNNITKFLGVE